MEWECQVIIYTMMQIFCQRFCLKDFWSMWFFKWMDVNSMKWMFIKQKEVTECLFDKKKISCLLTDCRLFLPRCNVRNARNRLASQTGMCSILLPVRFNTWRYIRFSRPSILGIRLYDRFRSFSFRHLSSFSIFSIMLLLRLSCCSFFSLSRFSMYCKQ